MKVFKVEPLIVDVDDIGPQEIVDVINYTKHANHCINPNVMNMTVVDVDWSDEHPLNIGDTQQAEFKRLFK